VDADPNNYMSYYKRATVYMALSRPRPALADLDMIMSIKPDFLKARQQRGGLLLKMGRLDEAHIDLENVVRLEPGNEEALGLYNTINTLREQIEDIHDYTNWNNYEPAIEGLTGVMEHIPWDHSLRELRADCYLGLGNIIHAISDLRSVAKLTSDNTAVYYKLASLHYQLGEADESLNEIRECLKLDPEHKDCYPLYKKIKKVAKFLTSSKEARESEDWEECVNNAQKVLKNEPQMEMIKFHAYDKMCQCQKMTGDTNASKKSCSEAIKIDDQPRLYCERAEAYLAEDMYRRPSVITALPWRGMKISLELRKEWQKLRNYKNRLERETTTKYSV